MNRLAGKTCLITAAASGMGRAGCELFAREGARVVAVGIDATRLDDVVASMRAAGYEVRGVVADLLEPAACQRAVEEAATWAGRLDVVWNHAGMSSSGDLDALDLDDYARCMDLNVRSAMVVTAAALPHLRRRGGSVVLTASVAGLVGLPESPSYNAAKSAVLGLMRSMATRHAREGIRVNAVCPGPIDTLMLREYLGTNQDGPEAQARLRKALVPVPMRRLGRPEEVAHAALWLASDDASYVTGVALPVDGGYVAG